jgi:hypothetical protein
MLTESMLATARAAAEAEMKSTCTIREKSSDEPTTGPGGAVTFPDGDVVYTGKCRVRPAGTQGSTAEAGGDEVFLFDYQISVPFSVTGIREGMPVKIDTSPDADLVGVTARVDKVHRGEDISARRLSCSDVA